MRRTSDPSRLICVVSSLVLLLAGLVRADLPKVLMIPGEGRSLGTTPIVVEIGDDLSAGAYSLDAEDGKPAQLVDVYRDQGRTYLATVLEETTLPARFKFRGNPSPISRPAGLGVDLSSEGRRIAIRVNGELLTNYVPDDGPKPYFYPLIGPTGARMTRAFPIEKVEGEKLDHPHHRSLWFTHGSVNKVDFWSEAPGMAGSSRLRGPPSSAARSMGDDPDHRRLARDPMARKSARMSASSGSSRPGRHESSISTFTLKATEGPVTFGDTKEGCSASASPPRWT